MNMVEPNKKNVKRLSLNIRGTVQGVGFRPFVYRLAKDIGLSGWVSNSPRGVQIEIEGTPVQLDDFVCRLPIEKPIHADIRSVQKVDLEPVGYVSFEVRRSELAGEKSAVISPDLATCSDCWNEINDPGNRRFRYPFTNCTNCGPRYSIIESLPYDRNNTTMKIFPMCAECRAEYEDPANRRFHAQPNACPACGPHLELWDSKGKILSSHDDSLLQACEEIKQGRILALKGLGGFQLMVDARNNDAVRLLRKRKNREEKPLALMYPSLVMVQSDCELSLEEQSLLTSAVAPIVLLKRKENTRTDIAPEVAPDNPWLGIMLPYTPLHHLLMKELNFPIVATSGNLAEEPICIDENDALDRLGQIADVFLVHNRPIARQVDDSLVRVMVEQAVVMRNARGYAPVTISLPVSTGSCLAVGAHLKNTVALFGNGQAHISQHIGDLETKAAFEAHKKVTRSLSVLYDFEPEKIACDLHPDYFSTKFARQLNLPTHPVQHHYAHILACLVDNQLSPPVLGIAWDGTGLGTDNTIWGGEFLKVDRESFSRLAHLRTFPLPGGDKAVRQPKRTAMGLLYEMFGEQFFNDSRLVPVNFFSEAEKGILLKMLNQKINSPLTSSAGRLFDGVASLIGLVQENHFEGQAAMRLEFAIDRTITDEYYQFSIEGDMPPYVVDWQPLLDDIIKDTIKKVSPGLISARFHNTLVEIIVAVAGKIGEEKVLLTGGCFQNQYLTERAFRRLQQSRHLPFLHKRIPPNDGGIAVGQIMAAAGEL